MIAAMFGLVESAAFADKLCLKVAFNKKTQKVKTTSKVGPVCPKGFKELVDTASFVGSQGPQGPVGPQGLSGPQGAVGAQGADGAEGKIDLASCRSEVATFEPCAAGSSCSNTLTCGGVGTSAGSRLNDYMIQYGWSLSNQAAYVTAANTVLAVGGTFKYPTGMTLTTASEEGYGPHAPSIGMVCCLPN